MGTPVTVTLQFFGIREKLTEIHSPRTIGQPRAAAFNIVGDRFRAV